MGVEELLRGVEDYLQRVPREQASQNRVDSNYLSVVGTAKRRLQL